MAMGNAGIGIYSRRRSELSVGTGPSRSMLGWKFSAAGCFRLSCNAYYRVFHSRDGRVVGCAHIEAMGVRRENADVAGAQYRPYPDCADALSSPADIPHSGCFRIKKNMEIVEVNFILDVSCLIVS